MLVVLTLIGIVAMNSATLTERMAHNAKDLAIAMQSAESALADGEKWLLNQSAIPEGVDACQTPPCALWQKAILPEVFSQSASWWQTNASPYSSKMDEVKEQPQYILQEHNFIPYELSPEARSRGEGYYYYKVISRGTGATNTSEVILESIYVTTYN